MTVPPLPGVRHLAAALLERATGVDPDRALAIAADVLGRHGADNASADSGRELAAEMLELAADQPTAGWRCSRCGSPRWVAASLTGPVSHGGRAIRQCVPCGHYSGDPVDEPPGVAMGLGGRLEPAEPGVDMSRPDDHGLLRHRHP